MGSVNFTSQFNGCSGNVSQIFAIQKLMAVVDVSLYTCSPRIFICTYKYKTMNHQQRAIKCTKVPTYTARSLVTTEWPWNTLTELHSYKNKAWHNKYYTNANEHIIDYVYKSKYSKINKITFAEKIGMDMTRFYH